MAPPRRPDPEPLETDDVRAVTVGTVAWAVLLLALLAAYPRLDEDGRGSWVWIAAAGFRCDRRRNQEQRPRRRYVARSLSRSPPVSRRVGRPPAATRSAARPPARGPRAGRRPASARPSHRPPRPGRGQPVGRGRVHRPPGVDPPGHVVAGDGQLLVLLPR